jgi:ubiquinone/menaquinone biosynthesis C-methylase UbiE
MGLGRIIAMRMFGCPSGVLGRLGGLIMARTNHGHGCKVAERLQVSSSDYVLEIGFGSGAVIECLTRLVAQGHVAGVDPSPVMVAQACSRNAAAIERGQVELLRGFADNLPFDEDVFDKGLTINSMQLWPDVGAGLEEILRVLKPGGRFAFGFTPHARQKPDGLAETLTAAGFESARLSHTDEGLYVLAEKPRRRVAQNEPERGLKPSLVEPNG